MQRKLRNHALLEENNSPERDRGPARPQRGKEKLGIEKSSSDSLGNARVLGGKWGEILLSGKGVGRSREKRQIAAECGGENTGFVGETITRSSKKGQASLEKRKNIYARIQKRLSLPVREKKKSCGHARGPAGSQSGIRAGQPSQTEKNGDEKIRRNRREAGSLNVEQKEENLPAS